MPNCELTRGRALNCKDSVSGIESVYMTTSDLGALTIGSEDEVTEIGGSSITVFEYALKGANGLETQINSSTESGTTFFESTLTLQLPKATKEDLKEIKMIVHSRPKVFVKLRSGDLLLVGEKYGVETSGSISSGQGLGDFSGINLTLVSQEANAPRYVVLSGATDADPFAGDVDITTTVGTNS
tara:strand:+ start:12005 stop:12556 length:552 start_codon:yes stop_codon:yes gene_type:complete